MEDVSPIESSSSQLCANIGPRERAIRVRFGAAATVVTLLALGGLLETHAPWWARIFIALPAFSAAMGFFQATAQTCVAFARKDIIVLGPTRASAVRVPDDKVRAQIAKQARRVYLNAVIATAVTVAVVLAIP